MQPANRKNILEALRRIGMPAPGKETAFDLMSPGPLMAPPEMTVVDAVKTMLAASRKWLVVVDENEKLIGLVDRQILLDNISGF
jgi:CBS domain-containing protein